MAKRMTREEKQAQREAESRAREAREYRELVKARRKDVVLAGQDDVFAARHDGRLAHVPEETVYALWRMVTAYHDAERAFGNELEWLQREIADQQRYVNEKRIYSSTNLGSKGVRCAEAQAKFFAAREALATLTQALGIHYGGLFTDADNAKRAEWLATYEACRLTGAYSPDAASAGRRALRNTCLGYLAELHDPSIYALCLKQFNEADNMTDTMAALSILANHDCTERVHALGAFHERWKEEALIVDKWLSVQATSRLPDTIDRVRQLLSHPAFDLRNPNKVYSLIRGFTGANHVRFHARDGRGYAFAADQIIALDQINPQVAARIARCFDRWKRFDDARQAAARAQLERIRAVPGLSRDVEEVVTRALA